MSIAHRDDPLCPGCLQALALINQADRENEFDAYSVIERLPFLLESTLTYLLNSFDYDTQRESRLGIAVRMLTVAATQAESLRADTGLLNCRAPSAAPA